MEKTAEMTIEEAAREERRKYYRDWRSKNKEKVKKHQEDYWRRKAAQEAKDQEA